MKNNKFQTYFFIGAIIFLGLLFIIGRYLSADIKDNHIVVVGTISDKNREKNGVRYDAYYHYQDKKYDCRFSAISVQLDQGDLIFIEISSKNPNNSNPLYKIKVPSCITTEAMPSSGWKEIPSCNQ